MKTFLKILIAEKQIKILTPSLLLILHTLNDNLVSLSVPASNKL